MTKLSVNINKIATIRNARGGNTPNVVKVAIDCERFGADGRVRLQLVGGAAQTRKWVDLTKCEYCWLQ